MTSIQTAAVGAGVLIAGIAVFQAALAIGLPLGEATLGGRAATTAGVLSPAFRVLAAISAVALIAIALLVMAHAGVISTGLFSESFLRTGTWIVVGFLALNTLGNFAAPHPVERWVMGSATLVIFTLVGWIVIRT